jgi:hypothetical protein
MKRRIIINMAFYLLSAAYFSSRAQSDLFPACTNCLSREELQEDFKQFREITSADALNPYFIYAQLMKRFSMFYASVFGFPDGYEINYTLPGRTAPIMPDIEVNETHPGFLDHRDLFMEKTIEQTELHRL